MNVEIVSVLEPKPKRLEIVGVFTDDKGKLINEAYKTIPLVIPENGITLDAELNKDLIEIVTKAKQLRHYFYPNKDGSRGQSQYFKIVDHDKEAEETIADFDASFGVMEKVKKMSDEEVKLFGTLIGLSGKPNVIKGNIIKMMNAGKTQLDMITSKLNDPDRAYLEVINFQIDKAYESSDENVGLRKNDGNVYYLNGSVIAVGLDKMIAYLKENDELFVDMKKEAVKA